VNSSLLDMFHHPANKNPFPIAKTINIDLDRIV
jgi:hypothetical protein